MYRGNWGRQTIAANRRQHDEPSLIPYEVSLAEALHGDEV